MTSSAFVALRRAAGQKPGLFAGLHTLLKESSLHGVPCERDGCSEVFLCNLPPSSAKLKLAESCGIKRIGGETTAVSDRVDLFKSPFGTIALCDCDRTIERHDC